MGRQLFGVEGLCWHHKVLGGRAGLLLPGSPRSALSPVLEALGTACQQRPGPKHSLPGGCRAGLLLPGCCMVPGGQAGCTASSQHPSWHQERLDLELPTAPLTSRGQGPSTAHSGPAVWCHCLHHPPAGQMKSTGWLDTGHGLYFPYPCLRQLT